jgi:hypothetical protein
MLNIQAKLIISGKQSSNHTMTTVTQRVRISKSQATTAAEAMNSVQWNCSWFTIVC